jgi:hypothetical protein
LAGGAALAVLILGVLLAGCAPADAAGGASATPSSSVPSPAAFCARFSAADLGQITGFTYSSSRVLPQRVPIEVDCSFDSPNPVPNDAVVANSITVKAWYYPSVNAAKQDYDSARQNDAGTNSSPQCTPLGVSRAADLSGLGDHAFVQITCRGTGSDTYKSYDFVVFLRGSTYVQVIGEGYPPSLEQVAQYVLGKLL